jgi:DNA-binding transcriptional ArsR family regulator
MIFEDDLTAFLHEPARLLLLMTLAEVRKADFVFLLNTTGLSRGNLSVQMTRLQEKGLISIMKEIEGNKPRTTYEISSEGQSALAQYKQQMREFLGL